MNQDTCKCLNCGNIYNGNYCNICGQSSKVRRLNLKQIMHDFFHAITHMDKGFIFSARELVLRPGHSTREYLQGRRAHHGNPFLMLVIIGGICSYLYFKINIRLLNSFTIADLSGDLHLLSSKYFAFSMILYCILFSLFDYLFFRYKKYNYIELFVFNTFIAVEVLFLNILLIPIYLLTNATGLDDLIRLVIMLAIIVYLFIARYQFFEIVQKDGLLRLFIEMLLIFAVFMALGWKSILTLFK